MNVYQIAPNLFRFEFYNLNFDGVCKDTELSGHFLVYWNKNNNKVAICKFGGFGGLTWFPEIKDAEVKFPGDKDLELLWPLLQREINRSSFWVTEFASNKDGLWLNDEINKAKDNGEYVGWAPNTVWDKPSYETFGWEGETWDLEKQRDAAAIKLLT